MVKRKRTCGLCGKPATGFAMVQDTWFCHGDDDESPTCYESVQSFAHVFLERP